MFVINRWWKKTQPSVQFVEYIPSPANQSCVLVCSKFINAISHNNHRDYSNIISLCSKYVAEPLLELEHFEEDKNTADSFHLYPVDAYALCKANTWSIGNPTLYSSSFSASSSLYQAFAITPYTTLHSNFRVHQYLNIQKHVREHTKHSLLPPILVIDISFKRFPSTQHIIMSGFLNDDTAFQLGKASVACKAFSKFIHHGTKSTHASRFKLMINEHCSLYHLDSFNIGNVLDVYGCRSNVVSVCHAKQRFIVLNFRLNFLFQPPANASLTDIALFFDEHLLLSIRLSRVDICKINHIPTNIVLWDRGHIYKYYYRFGLLSIYKVYRYIVCLIEKTFHLTRPNLDDLLLLIYCLFISLYVLFLIVQTVLHVNDATSNQSD